MPDLFEGFLQSMGNESFHMEEFLASETGQNMSKHAAYFTEYSIEDCPEVLEHWETRGLRKSLHWLEPGNDATKYARYLPLEAEHNPGKAYPLVFVLHGAMNPIYLAETYGYTDLAARDHFVVLMPEDENFSNLQAILNATEQVIQIDHSRIYTVGYSFGGYNSSVNALLHPGFFAAAGWGGMVFGGKSYDSKLPVGTPPNVPFDLANMTLIDYPGVELTDADIAAAAAHRMPVCISMGNSEVFNYLPFTQGEYDGRGMDRSANSKQNTVRLWQRVNHCTAPIRPADPSNPTEAMFDIPFDLSHTEIREGRSYHFGDFLSEDGSVQTRFFAIDGAAHWPTLPQIDIIWDFVTAWRRDPETGLSMRIEK